MAIDPMLAPVVALVAWTQVMLIWMAIQRGPAAKQAGIKFDTPGMRGQDLDRQLPPQANWAAHNYMHLMEQPTIFYAIVFALILMGASLPVNLWLAWGYVALRIIHSIVQATVNVIRIRAPIFFAGSLCLIALTLHAAMWVIDTARVGS